MTRELFLDVLKDVENYAEEKNIKRPNLIFIDGAGPHISIQSAKFCKAKKIQPWLLRPNMTHLLQPLDLIFFSSLKHELKKLVWKWQADPSHAGQTFNKYTIVEVLHDATEKVMKNPDIIKNGFKRSGIFPWDLYSPDLTKLLPGSIFAPTSKCPTMEDVTPKALNSPEDNMAIIIDAGVLNNFDLPEDDINNDIINTGSGELNNIEYTDVASQNIPNNGGGAHNLQMI